MELLHHFFDFLAILRQLRSDLLGFLNHLRETQTKNSQSLTSTVMEFAGNMPSLFLLHLQQSHALVRNSNLLRRFFSVMYVKATAHISFKRSAGCIAGHSSIEDPAILPAVMPQPILHLKRPARFEVR